MSTAQLLLCVALCARDGEDHSCPIHSQLSNVWDEDSVHSTHEFPVIPTQKMKGTRRLHQLQSQFNFRAQKKKPESGGLRLPCFSQRRTYGYSLRRRMVAAIPRIPVPNRRMLLGSGVAVPKFPWKLAPLGSPPEKKMFRKNGSPRVRSFPGVAVNSISLVPIRVASHGEVYG